MTTTTTSAALAGKVAENSSAAEALADSRSGDDSSRIYGSSACKCLGLDHTQGYAIANIAGQNVTYPSDVGAYCGAWDEGAHPDCRRGSPPDFCFQQWCYVDPCSCNTNTLPKTQAYFPHALYQNVPVHFSYETCGSSDTYTADYYEDACVNQNTEKACLALGKCSWSLSQGCVGSSLSGQTCDLKHTTDTKVWGLETCKCINIANKPGRINTTLENMTYPLSVGSKCQAWDEHDHPDCIGSGEKPDWCSQKWCYVDPCQCSSATPVVATLLADSSYHGYTVYYSYAACGGTDSFTSTENSAACVNQQTEEACSASPNACLWSFMGNNVGYACRGLEVATYCAQTTADEKSGASQLESASALLALCASALVLMRTSAV
mmetsp:Transcript_24285/g.60632  ORF Transcript_24285/g.60632 Transcript_24285/m.60632 type:complete len:378 (-) Transcript_24285:97-1230(-)